jgi:RNA polymerase sigma factor (sigma-70 family)
MSTNRPKKNRTRKSTGRTTATPAKRRKAKRKTFPRTKLPPPTFEDRMTEVYVARKNRLLARLRFEGISDPENVLHTAIEKILMRPCTTRKGLRYLPNRLWSRILSQMARQYRYQERYVLEDAETIIGNTNRKARVAHPELREVVDRIFKQLSARHARNLDWYYFQGRTVAEISALTGRKEGTVKSDLHRARQSALQVFKTLNLGPEDLCNLQRGDEG